MIRVERVPLVSGRAGTGASVCARVAPASVGFGGGPRLRAPGVGPSDRDLSAVVASIETITGENPYSGEALLFGECSIALNQTHWSAWSDGFLVVVFACQDGIGGDAPFRLRIWVPENPAWYEGGGWEDRTEDLHAALPEAADWDVRKPSIAAYGRSPGLGAGFAIAVPTGSTSGGQFTAASMRVVRFWLDREHSARPAVWVTAAETVLFTTLTAPDSPAITFTPDGTACLAVAGRDPAGGARTRVAVAWSPEIDTWHEALLFAQETADADLPSVAANDDELVVAWNVKLNTATTSADMSVWAGRIDRARLRAGFDGASLTTGRVAGPADASSTDHPCWDPSVVAWDDAPGTFFLGCQYQPRGDRILMVAFVSSDGGMSWPSAGAEVDGGDQPYNYFFASASTFGEVRGAWEARDGDIRAAESSRIAGSRSAEPMGVGAEDSVGYLTPWRSEVSFQVLPDIAADPSWLRWSLTWVASANGTNQASITLKSRVFDAA